MFSCFVHDYFDLSAMELDYIIFCHDRRKQKNYGQIFNLSKATVWITEKENVW